jgi:hypothetical protein
LPVPQAVPPEPAQPPQLFGSVPGSLQVAPHRLSPVGQHVPLMQLPLEPQLLPQLPQFEPDVSSLTHKPPQFENPEAQQIGGVPPTLSVPALQQIPHELCWPDAQQMPPVLSVPAGQQMPLEL